MEGEHDGEGWFEVEMRVGRGRKEMRIWGWLGILRGADWRKEEVSFRSDRPGPGAG